MNASAAALRSAPAEPTAVGGRKPCDRVAASAQQFESMLLGQWLADAESSFGSAPGSDDDQDSGGDQMKDFGIRQLAGQLTADGGIGIARMVKDGLLKASGRGTASNAFPAGSEAVPGMQSAASAALAYKAEAAR